MLVSAFLVGLGMAFVASLLIVPLLDPLGTIPPPPLLVSPVVVLGTALVALLGVSWFGGWLTNWRARKANLAEVMRLAD
jgi:ABC-type antimicrobial peptide transport system permease subunit